MGQSWKPSQQRPSPEILKKEDAQSARGFKIHYLPSLRRLDIGAPLLLEGPSSTFGRKVEFCKKEASWEPVNNWNPVWKIQFADVIVTDPFQLQRVVVLVRKKFILG